MIWFIIRIVLQIGLVAGLISAISSVLADGFDVNDMVKTAFAFIEDCMHLVIAAAMFVDIILLFYEIIF